MSLSGLPVTYEQWASNPVIPHAIVTELYESMVPKSPIINVRGKKYRATGLRSGDDSKAIDAAVADLHLAAAIGPVTLYLPQGCYRYTNQTPPGGGTIALVGLSNVSIVFDPGAELLIDNLPTVRPGILVRGSGDNIRIFNPRITWAGTTTRIAEGDGLQFLGYPSDAGPDVGWMGSGGQLSNITVVNSYVTNSPSTGMIFMGCSDVTVINHTADHTKADGLHFNACRRTTTIGCHGVHSGDDTLAYVNYYDPTLVFGSTLYGPFLRPALDEWSNDQSVAFGLVSRDSQADGLRLAGSLNVAVYGITVTTPNASGVACQAGPAETGTGAVNLYSLLASRGCLVSGGTITGTLGFGIAAYTYNSLFSDSDMWWKYDITFRDLFVKDCAQVPIRTSGKGVLNSGLSGLVWENIRVVGTVDVNMGSMRDCRLDNFTVEGGANFIITGTDIPDTTSLLSGRDRNNLDFGTLTVKDGGYFLFADLRDFTIQSLRAQDGAGGGVVFFRVIDFDIGQITVTHCNRSATSGVIVLQLAPAQRGTIKQLSIKHDSSGAALVPFTIGGGDAYNISASVILEKIVYINDYNQSTLGATWQTGTYAVIDWVYDCSYFNGGEATPEWRRERYGFPSWPESFVYIGAPTIPAAAGSTWLRSDGGAGTTLYVREGSSWTAK